MAFESLPAMLMAFLNLTRCTHWAAAAIWVAMDLQFRDCGYGQ